MSKEEDKSSQNISNINILDKANNNIYKKPKAKIFYQQFSKS